jgi:acetyl-CoA C-acetyltransferase
LARDLALRPLRIAGSALATDRLALARRPELLHLGAVARSTEAALQQAGLEREAIDLLELSDPHGITALLALEAAGFAPRGEGLALVGEIGLQGRLPLATGGGYKARGDVGGASGVYQVAELAQQLRGEAGARQVPTARVALAQCLGGLGSTAATHIIVAD